jgi:energy-coupling factor transporter transmembrane protein EcfT
MSIRFKIKPSMNEFWTLLTLWFSLFLPCTPVWSNCVVQIKIFMKIYKNGMDFLQTSERLYRLNYLNCFKYPIFWENKLAFFSFFTSSTHWPIWDNHSWFNNFKSSIEKWFTWEIFFQNTGIQYFKIIVPKMFLMIFDIYIVTCKQNLTFVQLAILCKSQLAKC